jgi:hypothetical protein
MYAIQREKMGRFGAADANAAIRMGSYAAIEGFDRGMRLAEMIDIRDRLALARGLDFRSTEHMCFVNGIRLKTNSRRIYRAIVEGYSPDYAWDPSLPFLTGHDPVRSLDTAQLANQPLDSAVVANILHGMEHMNLIHIDTVTSQRLRQIGRKIIGLPALKF